MARLFYVLVNSPCIHLFTNIILKFHDNLIIFILNIFHSLFVYFPSLKRAGSHDQIWTMTNGLKKVHVGVGILMSVGRQLIEGQNALWLYCSAFS